MKYHYLSESSLSTWCICSVVSRHQKLYDGRHQALAFTNFHTELNWTTPLQQINLGSWFASFTKALPLVLLSCPSIYMLGKLVWPFWMSIYISSFKHCTIFWHTSLSLPNYSMKSCAVLSVQDHYHCTTITYPMNSIWQTDSCTLCCLFHLLQVISPAENWNVWLTQKLQVRESYLLNMPGRKWNLTVWCMFYVG
jgi:hypothetical protein